eukprot:239668-Pyramimonas_sp.AAC.1
MKKGTWQRCRKRGGRGKGGGRQRCSRGMAEGSILKRGSEAERVEGQWCQGVQGRLSYGRCEALPLPQ